MVTVVFGNIVGCWLWLVDNGWLVNDENRRTQCHGMEIGTRFSLNLFQLLSWCVVMIQELAVG